jgi:hypothetical protein
LLQTISTTSAIHGDPMQRRLNDELILTRVLSLDKVIEYTWAPAVLSTLVAWIVDWA